jgi:hypothetical protein
MTVILHERLFLIYDNTLLNSSENERRFKSEL